MKCFSSNPGKWFFFLLGLFSNIWVVGETTVTIGTGTSTQRQPFGMWYGYERSASIYTYAEIGAYGYITSLKWYVGTSDLNYCPIKIYLKTTSSTSISSGTWTAALSGATLVYDGTNNFATTGWASIDIADFAYASSNLMVLCQTDFGEPGATTYPVFRYSSATGKHEYWAEVFPPTAAGTVNGNRPNIQILYTALSGVVPPSGFMAVAAGSSQVNLTWKKNSSNDNVMVAFNTVNTFGTPSGNYVAGNQISGGGTVIYNGSGTSFNQTTGLSPNTTYYYKAWSVHAPTPTYSSGASANATTFCTSITTFPYVTDFETTVFPPSCWKLAGVAWGRSSAASAYGVGSGSAKADFFSILAGNLDLISPQLDFSAMTTPVITFDEAYATYATEVDNLELWYSTDNGATYTLVSSWTGGPSGTLNTGGAMTTAYSPSSSQWARKRCPLPVETNKIMFRGISGHGNNLFLDNIAIFDTTCSMITPPYAENLDLYSPPSTGCLTVTNDNSDSQNWTTSTLYPLSAPNSLYIAKNSSTTMNDWFFSPQLNLVGGTTYLVSFSYRSGGAPFFEKLEVKFGTSPNASGMNGGQIWNNTSIQTSTFTPATAVFTPSGTGTYYVGWHGYSAANMSYLCIDDISVCGTESTWNGTVSSNWNESLNWTPSGIPTTYQTVTIPSGTVFSPSISASGLYCKRLTIHTGATLTILAGSVITIDENLVIQDGSIMNNQGFVNVNGNIFIQNE